MKIKHLGALEGRVLVFGGPYSNIHATRALYDWAQDHAIAPDHIICTGDVVAYCGAPSETIEFIRDKNTVVVAGNCEKQLAQGALDCGCGFDEGSACDLLSVGWYNFANTQVNAAQRHWMGTCPDLVTFTQNGTSFALLHGGISDIARFIWPTSPDTVFLEEIEMVERLTGPVDHILAGHSGMAFARQIGKHHWTNAGVIGMPPHDKTAQTAFATVEYAQTALHRLTYDANAAKNLMEARGLAHGYHEALVTGIWPSEDILPNDLRH